MLEKILREIEKKSSRLVADGPRFVMMDDVERIIRSHMKDDEREKAQKMMKNVNKPN